LTMSLVVPHFHTHQVARTAATITTPAAARDGEVVRWHGCDVRGPTGVHDEEEGDRGEAARDRGLSPRGETTKEGGRGGV
jgi:hypothetical protein